MARSRLRSGKVLHRGDQPGTAWKKKASGPIFGLKKRRQSYGLWAQAPTRQTHPHRLAERTLQAPDVLLVRPINGQKSCILDFGLVSTHELVLILSWHTNVLTPFYDSVSSLIAAGCFVVRNPYSRVMGVMVRRLTVSEYSLQQSASRG